MGASNKYISYDSSKKVSSNIKTKITIQRYNDNVDSLNLASSVAIVLSELKNQIIEK